MKQISCGVIVLAAVIMLVNTFAHPPKMSYDYETHSVSIQTNSDWSDLLPRPLPGAMRYNPPLYYYLLGKLSSLVVRITGPGQDPYYLFRLAHLVFIVLMACLFTFSLLPRFIEDPRIRLWSVISFFVLPNLYLSQVMVRPDHLLFFSSHLLFYLWFRYDFAQNLPFVKWQQIAWSLCLITVANSRHFGLVAFLVFFLLGCLVFWRAMPKADFAPHKKRIGVLMLITLLGSGYHYAAESIDKGVLFDFQKLRGEGNSIYKKYYDRAKDFDRRDLFMNFQFNTMLRTPNREAKYAKGNNALFPRLYNDFWADHWLYFSGAKTKQDVKMSHKRRALLAGAAFSILILLGTMTVFIQGLRRLAAGKPLDWDHCAALLSVGGFVIYLVAAYLHPRVGKNDIAKACYLLGFYWFPILSTASFLNGKPILTKIVSAYTAVLFTICLPLYIF